MSQLSEFKKNYTFEERKGESERIMKKYEDRIPIIVERSVRTDIPEIDKKKYLVPKDITVGQFVFIIRKRIKLSQENQGNFIRVGKNFMKDLSHIRNVAIPNVDNNDYESLGRVVSKIKIQEKERITGPQNIVAKQKLMIGYFQK